MINKQTEDNSEEERGNEKSLPNDANIRGGERVPNPSSEDASVEKLSWRVKVFFIEDLGTSWKERGIGKGTIINTVVSLIRSQKEYFKLLTN